MDNKSTTKRMIGAVVLVLIAALLLAWLLKGKNQSVQEQQELIAEQTQDATPILGFPGVKEEEGAEQAAAQDGEAPYVIGAADGTGDDQQGAGAAQQGDAGTEQVAQNDQNEQQATDGADAGTVSAGAATGDEAAQKLTDGFKVRDDSGDGEQEQRQVVADGKAKAGTGSMGSSEIALPKQAATGTDAAAGSTDTATQEQNGQQQTASTDAAGQSTGTEKSADTNTQQASSAGGTGGDNAATQQAKAPQKQAAANPKLVDEKPVPAPRSQSSSGSSKVTTSAASGSGSSGASSSRSQQSTGGKGYAIQVLAASSRNKAEQVRESIAVDGYPVFVVRANVNGKTVYRVRVGTYPAKNAARAVQSKMKARYTKNQYVQNSFVTRN